MKKQLLFLLLCLYSVFILSQESYYDNVNLNLTGISLKEALATKIITTHTNNLSYVAISGSVKVAHGITR